MPETGALILTLLLGSIIEAIKQVLYLPYEVNYQQEAMCVSWDESALLPNEVESVFVSCVGTAKGETGLLRRFRTELRLV